MTTATETTIFGIGGFDKDEKLVSQVRQEFHIALFPAHYKSTMHVQYSLSETTRIHDLSTRKMHLIR